MLVDLDSAFKDVVRASAGQTHWQNGVAERWFIEADIWNKLVEDKLVFKDEMPEAAASVSDAKNQLRNRSGYSHRQWVFGSNGRQPQDLLDADSQDLEAMDLASPDTKLARTQVLRVGAKAAFFACQSKEAVQRAINNKPRVDNKAFQAGDLVYALREVGQGKGKKPKSSWLGPGVIIGREGSNYWMARGGRCILAALEHLRTAHHEEVSETLRLKTAMTEVRKLLDQPLFDDEEIDESYDGPGPQEVNPEDLAVAMEAENDPVLCLLHGKGLSQEKNRSALLSEEKRARRAHPYAVFITKRCISYQRKERRSSSRRNCREDASTEKPNSSNGKNTLSSEQSGPFQWKSRRKLLRLSPKRGS